MFSKVKVCKVVLIIESLTLKRNVPIRRHAVPVLDEPDNPFDEIPEEEKDDEHLLLLLDMNGLMPDSPVRNPSTLAGEYHPYCCHCVESLEGNESVVDNLCHSRFSC